MDINELFVDVDLEAEGVWFEVDDETSVLVARSNNRKYRDMIKQLTKPYKRQIRQGTLKDATLDNIIGRAMAKTLLLNWKGLKIGGEEISYSVEKATELLTNEKLKDFREMIAEFANDAEAFRLERKEEIVGN